MEQNQQNRQNELQCPICGSENVVQCKGGTALIDDDRINWICSICLYEW